MENTKNLRHRFDVQMKDIHQELVEMGMLIERALENAEAALLDGKRKKAEKTHRYEYDIDRKEREIERMCMHVLLTQQPVAGDLRLVSAALKMITDMERIGDQAADISEIAVTIDRSTPFNSLKLKDMFDCAVAMVKDSINSFVQSDLRLAKSVILGDDTVDGLFRAIRGDLIARLKSPADTLGEIEGVAEQSIDLLMAIKYIERIADHACNIAEWVIYSITGEHISRFESNAQEQA